MGNDYVLCCSHPQLQYRSLTSRTMYLVVREVGNVGRTMEQVSNAMPTVGLHH